VTPKDAWNINLAFGRCRETAVLLAGLRAAE